ncbi:DUF551 domain-containing protein [Klebsiella pneumoniae]|uniref:DUF551 domain-containing protein n=1 Tax=Klebsiella pneumoniae TaxID=573 RepID=UPI0027F59DE5|nr:DUF551 domain-containing protein [Klebsiella pneumoniae]
MKEELLLLRNQLKMGHRISFAEAMLLQRAIDILVSKAGNLPVNDVTAGKLFTNGDVVTAESPTTMKTAPALDLLPKNAESLTGNSPAQSDCLPAKNVVAPAQNQGWIPVSERMPESNGVYFGWDGKRVLEVNCFFGGFSANQFIHGEITHWMPLPAAPQEVKGE